MPSVCRPPARPSTSAARPPARPPVRRPTARRPLAANTPHCVCRPPAPSANRPPARPLAAARPPVARLPAGQHAAVRLPLSVFRFPLVNPPARTSLFKLPPGRAHSMPTSWTPAPFCAAVKGTRLGSRGVCWGQHVAVWIRLRLPMGVGLANCMGAVAAPDCTSRLAGGRLKAWPDLRSLLV